MGSDLSRPKSKRKSVLLKSHKKRSASEEILNRNIHVSKHTDLIKNVGAYEPPGVVFGKTYPTTHYSRSVPTTPAFNESRFLSSPLNASTVFNRNSRPRTPYHYGDYVNDDNKYFFRSSSDKYIDSLQPILPPIVQTMYYDNDFREFRTYDRIVGIQTENMPIHQSIDEAQYTRPVHRTRHRDPIKHDNHDYKYYDASLEKGRIYQNKENNVYGPRKPDMEYNKNSTKNLDDLMIYDNEHADLSISKSQSKKIALKIPKNASATSNTSNQDEEIVYVPMKKSDFLRKDRSDETNDNVTSKSNDFIILKEKEIKQGPNKKQHQPLFKNHSDFEQVSQVRLRDNSAESSRNTNQQMQTQQQQQHRTISIQTNPDSNLSFFNQNYNNNRIHNQIDSTMNATDSNKLTKSTHEIKTFVNSRFTAENESTNFEAMFYERNQITPKPIPVNSQTKKVIKNTVEINNGIFSSNNNNGRLSNTGSYPLSTSNLCDSSTTTNKKIVFPELLNFTKQVKN